VGGRGILREKALIFLLEWIRATPLEWRTEQTLRSLTSRDISQNFATGKNGSKSFQKGPFDDIAAIGRGKRWEITAGMYLGNT
jgi:hypothetical protein